MRATTFSTPKVSLATRAARMFELSPGDRRESPGALDSGLGERVTIEPGAGHAPPGETRAEAAERVRILIDHGDRVPQVLHAQGQRGTHAAAAHDHDMQLPGLLGRLWRSSWPRKARRRRLAALCLSSVGRAAQGGVRGRPAGRAAGPTLVFEPDRAARRGPPL